MAAIAFWLTFSITKLELLCNGKLISTATGFFYRYEGNWYLITNWHVFSGRNHETGQPLNADGAVPTHCKFFVSRAKENTIVWSDIIYELGDAYEKSANWFQHPDLGQAYDVAALPIHPDDVGVGKDFLDPEGHDPNMLIDLGGELFIPGFPLGLTATGLMPLWKRASLASTLEIGEGIDQYFFVDTATREGMSGAPCLAISQWRHYSRQPGQTKLTVVENPMAWRLMGVYSGRLNPSDSFEAQIGKVWRLSLIDDVVMNKIPAVVALTSK